MRMLAECGDQRRVPLFDLLERHASPFVHEVDEAEIARPHDHDLAIGHVVLRLLLGGVRARCLTHRESDHRVLLVATGEAGDGSRCE